jgi:hypothetical protein
MKFTLVKILFIMHINVLHIMHAEMKYTKTFNIMWPFKRMTQLPVPKIYFHATLLQIHHRPLQTSGNCPLLLTFRLAVRLR